MYDADVVAFDPFSPGKHLGARAQATLAGVRTQLLETLASLGKVDTPFTAFYEQRRGYFSGLELGSGGDSEKAHLRSRRELEQLALAAAERGDIATIESVGRELRDYKDENEKNSASEFCRQKPLRVPSESRETISNGSERAGPGAGPRWRCKLQRFRK